MDNKNKRQKTKEKKRKKYDHSQLELNMIRAQLALPKHKRTNFLRKKLPNGGSFL